jgi:hypothetical protein
MLGSSSSEDRPEGRMLTAVGVQVPVKSPETSLAMSPPKKGGRPPSVNAGGRVVGTSSLLLWQVLTDAYSRLQERSLSGQNH